MRSVAIRGGVVLVGVAALLWAAFSSGAKPVEPCGLKSFCLNRLVELDGIKAMRIVCDNMQEWPQ